MSAADVLALLAAILAAAAGGAAFVKGVVGIAAWSRLAPALVATTLAAMATSSPELSVSTLAALAGQPEIGLGDALGSNVVNLGLILGATLLIGPLAARIETLRRDFVLALAVPALTALLALDGSLSRVDGALLLAVLLGWLALSASHALASRGKAPEAQDRSPVRPLILWLLLLGGLACLLLAGRLFVIGATVVAIGTSLPELVTVLVSRLKGHDDVGLGTLLGSNLFNGLGIVGVAASIWPISVSPREVSTALAFGMVTVLLMLPRAGVLSRRRGFVLVSAYAAFVAATAAASL